MCGKWTMTAIQQKKHRMMNENILYWITESYL